MGLRPRLALPPDGRRGGRRVGAVKTEETILLEALAKGSAAEQAAYLDEACAGDARLRADVEALLSAHARAAGILETSAVDLNAASQAAQSPHQVGSTIGPYKLLEQIGAGGMGVVF